MILILILMLNSVDCVDQKERASFYSIALNEARFLCHCLHVPYQFHSTSHRWGIPPWELGVGEPCFESSEQNDRHS